jgi:hypothetical protein
LAVLPTELLQRAIAEIQKLPAEEQDAIASRILADLEDERVWAAQFATTTDDQWDRMAEQVRRDIAAGGTVQLDDVFPLKASDV